MQVWKLCLEAAMLESLQSVTLGRQLELSVHSEDSTYPINNKDS